ncbi:MAG: hypothetical protein FWE57_08250 [Chitinispirillia bacterium]|nr:hypothetical protein [Chitinispirillia bacterium]
MKNVEFGCFFAVTAEEFCFDFPVSALQIPIAVLQAFPSQKRLQVPLKAYKHLVF